MKNWHKIFKGEPCIVPSEEEMLSLGEQLAAGLEAGDVVGFVGDLGAGKTHLIAGILRGLGEAEAVSSPTFALVHEHHGGRLPVAHFDLYRMKDEQEAISIGWDEYLQSDAVLLVEWADRFDGTLMPEETQWLVLRHCGPSERSVEWVPSKS